VLPDQPLPGGKSRADALVDLALRVLPSVAIMPTSAPAPQSAPQPVPPSGPMSQAGASG
jgi:hypothetical protein